MTKKASKPISPSDELSQGQMVIIIARWILVLSGLFLILWDPGAISTLRFKIMFLLMLAASNFYLCTQVLRRRPTLEAVVYGASLADLAVITAIILSEGGFESNTYTFYFPALLALSVAFPTFMLVLFAGGAVAAYAGLSLLTLPDLGDGNLQTLLIRLLMLVAITAVGHQFRRIERRRQEALPSNELDTASQPASQAASS
jgi:hypothetical protein